MTHVFKLVASLAVSLIANASAAMAADVNHGEQLARRWCAGCHAVAPDQQQITEALSFTSVAGEAGFRCDQAGVLPPGAPPENAEHVARLATRPSTGRLHKIAGKIAAESEIVTKGLLSAALQLSAGRKPNPS